MFIISLVSKYYENDCVPLPFKFRDYVPDLIMLNIKFYRCCDLKKYIFFSYYIFREENLLIDSLPKENSRNDTLLVKKKKMLHEICT